MTIYVDDWKQRARVGRLDAYWSHLLADPADGDDLAGLHELAARIGLRGTWFQNKPWPRAHYDVTETKRVLAIAAGAVAIGWREAGQMRTDAIAARNALRQERSPTP